MTTLVLHPPDVELFTGESLEYDYDKKRWAIMKNGRRIDWATLATDEETLNSSALYPREDDERKSNTGILLLLITLVSAVILGMYLNGNLNANLDNLRSRFPNYAGYVPQNIEQSIFAPDPSIQYPLVGPEYCGTDTQILAETIENGNYGLTPGAQFNPGEDLYIANPTHFLHLLTKDADLSQLEAVDITGTSPFDVGGYALVQATRNWGNDLRMRSAGGGSLPTDIYFQQWGPELYRNILTQMILINTDPSNPDVHCLHISDSAPDISDAEFALLIDDQVLPQSNNPAYDSIPQSGGGINPTATLEPTPTPQYVLDDTPFNQDEEVIVTTCAETTDPLACEAYLRQNVNDGDGLTEQELQGGVDAGNNGCAVTIDSVNYNKIRNGEGKGAEIASLTTALRVWRVNNNDPSTLTGVGVIGPDGRYTVCVSLITNAPAGIAGGSWSNRSDSIVANPGTIPASFVSAGGEVFGGIIAFDPVYQEFANNGVYRTNNNNAYVVFEMQDGGVWLSPMTNVTQVYPTPNPSITPLPAPIQAVIVITSTPGPTPVPSATVLLVDLRDHFGGSFYVMLMQSGSGGCANWPLATFDDGRPHTGVIVDFTGTDITCTESMTIWDAATSGATQVGDVWIKP